MFPKSHIPFSFTQGLKANVIVPFEEGHLMKSDFNFINEDSSNRKRSSSLTEQVNKLPQLCYARYFLMHSTIVSASIGQQRSERETNNG